MSKKMMIKIATALVLVAVCVPPLFMQSFSSNYSGVETYTVERNGQELTLTVTPEYDSDSGMYLIGISAPDAETININLLNCFYYGGYEMKMITKLMFTTLAALFLHVLYG